MASRRLKLRIFVFAAMASVSMGARGQVVGSGPLVPGSGPQLFHQRNGLPPTNDGKKYSLSGTVVNSQTGEGIPRALVEINNQIPTLTDSSGNFSFEGLAAERYFVTSRKPGYFDTRQTSRRMTPQTVQVGPDLTRITIKLDPEAIISGHVTDSDGLPVQRLPVRCLRSRVFQGRRQWEPAGNATTDEDGEYRIAGLVQGRYLLIAGPSRTPSLGAMTKIGRQFAGYGAAYYPAPADSSGRDGARISAGQKVVADLSVEAQPFYTIEGDLNVPTGFSVGISLRPRDPAAEPGGMGMRRDGNSFKILMVPKGDYFLEASAHVENKNWFADVPLHVDGDITGLQIALQPGVSIPLNVSTQRTQTTSQPQVFSTHLQVGLPMQMILSPTDRLRQQSYVPTPRPPDNSSFAFDGVAPGTYKLDFSPYGDLYVASARYGSVDLLRENLLVSESSSDAIELVLRDDGAKLKGSMVSDGQPAEGALLIVPGHGDAYEPRSMSRLKNGDFELRNLTPGSYSVLAFDNLDNLEYSNPDVLAPYLSHAAHVDLAANQEGTVTLELIKRGDEE